VASLVLADSDIGLFADFAATRLVLPHLMVADPEESWDEAVVQFYGDTDPTAYRGVHRTATVRCQTRWTHRQHAGLVSLVALLRSARTAADGRLMLRTNHGLVAGFDELLVGTVSQWPRPRVMGQTWDVTFTLTRVEFTVGV